MQRAYLNKLASGKNLFEWFCLLSIILFFFISSNGYSSTKTEVEKTATKLIYVIEINHFLTPIQETIPCFAMALFNWEITRLDKEIGTKFERKRGPASPAVYTRPLELYPSKIISPEELIFEMRKLKYKKISPLKIAGDYHYTQEKSMMIFKIYIRQFKQYDTVQKSIKILVLFDGNKVTKIVNIDSNKEVTMVRLEPVKLTSIVPLPKGDPFSKEYLKKLFEK